MRCWRSAAASRRGPGGSWELSLRLQAFRYLFLALWFGLHAFVAAQAYKVRILTQLVRLPIPSRLGDRRIATEVGRALRQIS